MFDEYINVAENTHLLETHFEHHKNIVLLINKLYSTKKGVELETNKI